MSKLDPGALSILPGRSFADTDGIFDKVLDQVARDVLPPNPVWQKVMDQALGTLLHDDDASRYSSQERSGAALKRTANDVAEQLLLLKSPQEVAAFLTLLAAVVGVIAAVVGVIGVTIQLIAALSTLHQPSPQQTTNQVIINNQTTINVTPAPPPNAPPGQCPRP